MKAFLAGVAAAIAIAVIAGFVLQSQQQTASEHYRVPSSVRL